MKWRVVIGFLVGLVAIGAFVVFVGWEEVLTAFGETEPAIYALAFALTVVALVFRSLVWAQMFSVLERDLRFPTIAGMFVSAKFFKYISPYGQISATPGIAWFVGGFTDADYEHNLATIVSADLFTYSPYYTFGGLALLITLFGAAPLPNVEWYLLASAILVVILALALWTVLFRREVTTRIVIVVLKPVAWLLSRLGLSIGEEFTPAALRERISGFYDTIDSLRDQPRTLVAGFLFGHLAWLFLMLPLVVVATAMSIELGVVLAMLVVALSKLGFVVPLPGGLGGVEFTIAGLLVLVADVSSPDAVAIAILYRLSTFWLTVLIGGLAASIIIIRWPGRDSFLGR